MELTFWANVQTNPESFLCNLVTIHMSFEVSVDGQTTLTSNVHSTIKIAHFESVAQGDKS